MVLYGLFCCEDCNRIGRNPYYKINDKGRLRNERWGILSLRKFLMDQRNVSQIETRLTHLRDATSMKFCCCDKQLLIHDF